MGVLCSALVLSPSPVTAAVGDNLSSAFAVLSEWLGIGKEDSVPADEDFSTASLVEKVNYLEEQNAALVTKVSNQAETIDRLFSMSVSTAYTDSQVKSTKATVLSPKQVLLQWDLTNTDDCTTAGSSASALGDWTIIEKFNVYYGTSSRTSDMTLVKTIEVAGSKAFYDDYSYQFNGLNPNVQYYFWVTSVVEGGTQLSGSSAVRALRTPTLASAQATGLTLTPTGKYSMSVSWNAVPYSGYQYYRVYYSTSPLSVSMATTPNTTTSSNSVTLTGLTLGATYYVGVCAVLNDGNVWVGGLSNGTNYSSKLQFYSISFSTASWADIAEYTKAGFADDVFTVGDTKTVNMSSLYLGNATVTIVDMASDGKSITCMFTGYSQRIPTHVMHSSYTNEVFWSGCEMRSYLNGPEFYGKIPSDLRSVIADTNVISAVGWNSLQTTVDKLWLPARKQIKYVSASDSRNEDYALTRFKYFADGASTDLADYWWLRSSYLSGDACFNYVQRSTIGAWYASDAYATNQHAVFPCFTIK